MKALGGPDDSLCLCGGVGHDSVLNWSSESSRISDPDDGKLREQIGVALILIIVND